MRSTEGARTHDGRGGPERHERKPARIWIPALLAKPSRRVLEAIFSSSRLRAGRSPGRRRVAWIGGWIGWAAGVVDPGLGHRCNRSPPALALRRTMCRRPLPTRASSRTPRVRGVRGSCAPAGCGGARARCRSTGLCIWGRLSKGGRSRGIASALEIRSTGRELEGGRQGLGFDHLSWFWLRVSESRRTDGSSGIRALARFRAGLPLI